MYIIAMEPRVLLVILAIIIVVVVVVMVWYASQHSGPPHRPWTPIGPTEHYYIKSKGNGQYLQWRTGVWVLAPHPGDGDTVTQKNSGHGTQILYDHPSGKVLLPPNGTAPASGENRVILGDFATHPFALNYNPNTSTIGFGVTYDLFLAGNQTAKPFLYTTGYPDQQWDMEAVPR